MSCKGYQQRILENDWSEATLRSATELFAHVQECDECRRALEDYDRLRGLLSSDEVPDPAGYWDRFEADLVRSVNALAPSAPAHARPPRTGRWLAALAASLLLAAVGWAFYLHSLGENRVELARTTQTKPDGNRFGDEFRLTEADIRQSVALFRQVAEVVDDRIGWVAVSGDTAELGVSNEAVDSPKNVLIMRLVLTRDERSPVCTNLVLVPGQTVALTVPFDHGKTIHYRVKANGTDAHEVSLAAEVDGKGDPAESKAVLSTHLKPVAGEVVRAGSIRTSEGDYELAMAFADHSMGSLKP